MQGHLLWHASRVTADYLEEHAGTLVRDRTVLELGAGAGLPSLVCALHGATKVVATDYPDEDLIRNLRYNIERNRADNIVVAEGYLWGNSPSRLLGHLPGGAAADRRFDLLILADLLFNHSEHGKLVGSVQQTLKRAPHATALVFFTPHRPWLLERDMAFFALAAESGFAVDKVLERTVDTEMDAAGPRRLRRSVHDLRSDNEALKRVVLGYALRWADLS